MRRSLSIYLNKDLEDKLKRLATLENRSLSNFIVELLNKALAYETERVVLDQLVPEFTKVLRMREDRWANLLARSALDAAATRNFVLNALSELPGGPSRERAYALNEAAYSLAVSSLKTGNEDLFEIIAAIADIDDAREAAKVIQRLQEEVWRQGRSEDE